MGASVQMVLAMTVLVAVAVGFVNLFCTGASGRPLARQTWALRVIAATQIWAPFDPAVLTLNAGWWQEVRLAAYRRRGDRVLFELDAGGAPQAYEVSLDDELLPVIARWATEHEMLLLSKQVDGTSWLLGPELSVTLPPPAQRTS